MNKKEFLDKLKSELIKRKVAGLDEIMADYEEHFSHALSSGKSETEASEKLGNPVVIARAYETDTLIQNVKNPEKGFEFKLALSVIFRLLLLAPVNFLIILIPGVVAASLLVAGWATAIALGSVGFAILSFLPVVASLSLNFWTWIAGIFTSLGVVGLAVIGLLIMFQITKLSILALINYLRWNLRFVLDK
jgi:Predicted membrane protein